VKLGNLGRETDDGYEMPNEKSRSLAPATGFLGASVDLIRMAGLF